MVKKKKKKFWFQLLCSVSSELFSVWWNASRHWWSKMESYTHWQWKRETKKKQGNTQGDGAWKGPSLQKSYETKPLGLPALCKAQSASTKKIQRKTGKKRSSQWCTRESEQKSWLDVEVFGICPFSGKNSTWQIANVQNVLGAKKQKPESNDKKLYLSNSDCTLWLYNICLHTSH